MYMPPGKRLHITIENHHAMNREKTQLIISAIFNSYVNGNNYLVVGREGVIKGAFGVLTFPTNIPYSKGNNSEQLRVFYPSNR